MAKRFTGLKAVKAGIKNLLWKKCESFKGERMETEGWRDVFLSKAGKAGAKSSGKKNEFGGKKK